MKLTTETAKELKIVIENEIFFEGKNRYKEGYAHGRKDSIISFKNELKEEIPEDINPLSTRRFTEFCIGFVKEIESVENG